MFLLDTCNEVNNIMKLIKISFYVIGLLILISVLSVASLIYFIDLNKLKPVLTEEVKKQTGYDLAIDGKLTWSFYPRIAIKIDKLTLRNPSETTPFVELNNTRIATELGQLLKGNEKLEGQIAIDSIRFMNLHASQADANLIWKNNVLTIDAIKANFYNGTLTGAVQGRDLISAKPRWDWTTQIKDVALQNLLQDVNGESEKVKLSGTAQVKLEAYAIGKTKQELIQNLNGQTEFKLANGIIKGVDFNYFVQMANAFLNKETMPAAPNLNQTAFQEIVGSGVIKNGVVETNNLSLTSEAFLIKGTGHVNLNDQSIRMMLQIKPQQVTKIQWEVPVIVSGELANPDVRLDTVEIEKFIAIQQIEKVKEKANEIIQKNVPGKAGEFLQNLIGK